MLGEKIDMIMANRTMAQAALPLISKLITDSPEAQAAGAAVVQAFGIARMGIDRIGKIQAEANAQVDKVQADANAAIDKIQADANLRIAGVQGELAGQIDAAWSRVNALFHAYNLEKLLEAPATPPAG